MRYILQGLRSVRWYYHLHNYLALIKRIIAVCKTDVGVEDHGKYVSCLASLVTAWVC